MLFILHSAFVSSSLWPRFMWRKNNQVRAWNQHIRSNNNTSILCLFFSYGRRFHMLFKSEVPFPPPPPPPQFLRLLVRSALPFTCLPFPTRCLSLAVGIDVRVRPLHWAQFTITLRILDDCCVAEVVLVPSLNAESPLRTHPPHCLSDVHCTDVLQPGQADVQCTESSLLTGKKKQRKSWKNYFRRH